MKRISNPSSELIVGPFLIKLAGPDFLQMKAREPGL